MQQKADSSRRRVEYTDCTKVELADRNLGISIYQLPTSRPRDRHREYQCEFQCQKLCTEESESSMQILNGNATSRKSGNTLQTTELGVSPTP
jgi:hypothetical protein